jgi:hypothetical protein
MGWYLLRPTPSTRAMLAAYLRYEDDHFNDQEMYQRVEHLLPDVGKCCLPRDLYRESCTDPTSILPDTNAITVHAICMTGLETKKAHFRARKAWFLPDMADAEARLAAFRAAGLPLRV